MNYSTKTKQPTNKNKMKNQMELARSFPYCKGFVDGYSEGVDNNPFEKDIDRHEYRIGYDAGVAEYCEGEDFEK